MQITHKTMAALVAVSLALFAGAAAILDRAVRPGFERLEAMDHARNQARVSANLALLASDMRARAVDYAQWDDTYAFVAGSNPDYTDDLTDAWFEDYGVDFAVFADSYGRVLWSRMRHVGGDGFIDAPAGAAVLDMVRAAQDSREPRLGVVCIEGLGFVMVAARPATRSDGGGAPRGWVVFGRRMPAEALREQAQLHIELVRAAAPPADLADRVAALAERPSQTWTTPDAILSLSALRDFDGAVVGGVLTRQERDVTALGARSMALALGLFAGMLALGATALWVLLRAMMIRRIERLERHFNAQAHVPAEMPLHAGAHDEISRLTSAYNRLVARVRDAAARERAAHLQREAEAAANRMKSDFLANISHELRRPLDAIIGYSELIVEEASSDERERFGKDVDRIAESARYLMSLILEILDLSKIDAGRLEVRPETFNVAEMVQSAVAAVAPLADAQRARLEVKIDDDLREIYSDQRRLRQCIVNVLSNACRLSPGAAVVLHASRGRTDAGDTLRFEVSDTGRGLTPGQLAQAFEPFAQLDPETTRRLGVAGLTLAVTRKLIALLGGHIEARSAPGQGSVFVLVLPAVADEAANAQRDAHDLNAA